MCRRSILGFVLFLLTSPLAHAQAGRIIQDLWDAAYLDKGKAGFIRTFTEEFEQSGQRILRTTSQLRLQVKRNQDLVQLSMDTGTYEAAADGKVLAVFLRQFIGKNKTVEITGLVKGTELHLTLDGNQPLKPAPWNDKVVGLYRQQKLLADRKAQPGDTFTYLSFEPSINLVLETTTTVQDYQEVELFNGKQKKKLLRVETRPERIEGVQLPPLAAWVGEDYQPQRSQVEVPGLGLITLYRTTQAYAQAPGPIAQLPDVSFNHLVRLNKRLPYVVELAEAVYRVRYLGEDNPEEIFTRDSRQEIRKLQGKTFDLHVKGVGVPEKNPASEYLQSSYFITSDDPRVKQLARQAAAGETDSWKKALRIEKWVHDKMKPSNQEAVATADHVAKTLEGDCTEYAMLTAAMCRAEGIPSRTAVGLVYAEVKGQPVLAFHMWTEVWNEGQWHGLDATLGRGRVGAGHLKVSDHSWHETRTLTPLFPVMRVVGKVGIEVVSYETSR